MKDFFERYDRLIIPEPNTGCSLWLGAFIDAGYGHGYRDGEHFLAHRSAYECVNGLGSADGLLVCHSCDNPPCVLPEHLIAGTHQDNMADMFRRGRGRRARGERCGPSKLTEPQVIEIRRLAADGMPVALIRQAMLLTHLKWDTIQFVVIGRTWAHVPGALGDNYKRLRRIH